MSRKISKLFSTFVTPKINIYEKKNKKTSVEWYIINILIDINSSACTLYGYNFMQTFIRYA